MALLGSEERQFPSVMNLKTYLEKFPDPPKRSYVKTIFKPGKYPQWSFVTDHNFRVNVYEGNVLYEDLHYLLGQFENEDTCLYVQIDDVEQKRWSLHSDEQLETRWEEKSFGLMLFQGHLAKKRPRASKKTATNEKDLKIVG